MASGEVRNKDVIELLDKIRYDGEFARSLSGDLAEYGDLQAALRKRNYDIDDSDHLGLVSRYLDLRNSTWMKVTDLNFDVMQRTLNSAAKTYRNISYMSLIMFAVGTFLFLLAGLYSAYSNQTIYALVLGGLGTANFIALFLFKPMEKSEQALSDLLQAEIIFMNYYGQERICKMLTYTRQGLSNYDIDTLEKASERLQKKAVENIRLCQRYLEVPIDKVTLRSPTAPVNLTASSPASKQVVLSWETPTDSGGDAITNYIIYRGTTTGLLAKLIALGDVLTFTDTTVEDGKTYYYKVSAKSSLGEGSLSKEVSIAPGQA